MQVATHQSRGAQMCAILHSGRRCHLRKRHEWAKRRARHYLSAFEKARLVADRLALDNEARALNRAIRRFNSQVGESRIAELRVA